MSLAGFCAQSKRRMSKIDVRIEAFDPMRADLTKCTLMSPLPSPAFASPSAGLEPDASISYKSVDGRSLRMLVFNPEGERDEVKLPSVILIHGGGWTSGSPDLELYKREARSFNSFGLRVFSVQYRLVENGAGSVESCVRDVRSAMRYLKAHACELGVDSGKIVACGGSAGAHLSFAEELFNSINEPGEDLSVSTEPAAIVAFYPVIDTSQEGYGQEILGSSWREFSPLHNVKPGMPPVLILHAKDDAIAPYLGSVKFKAAMDAAGGSCELVSYESGGHGFIANSGEAYEDAMAKVEEFLSRSSLLPKNGKSNNRMKENEQERM